MDGAGLAELALIDPSDLGRLMPMFVWLGPQGEIRAVGPTITRLCDGASPVGQMVLDVFRLEKPHPVRTMDEFSVLMYRRLHVSLRNAARTRMRGIAVPLQGGAGVLVNLSLGISAAEAVREHRLSNADFAPTDLTVELLYLTEVKALVMEELAALNQRLRVAQRRAEEQALTDALTGLANRRALDLVLERMIDLSVKGIRQFALLRLDLDFFKAVNDTLGHAAGDLVLEHVAEVLLGATRKQDTVARVGGDEFVLILPGLDEDDTITAIARRIINELEVPITYDGQPCRISGSIGATLSGLYIEPDADKMMSDADTALYVSKRRGRGRSTVYKPGLKQPEDKRGAADRR